MNHITKGINLIGLQPLARSIGVTYQAVRKWKLANRIPADRVLAFEEATGHQVSRHELRPDIYPIAKWCRCPACRAAKRKRKSA